MGCWVDFPVVYFYSAPLFKVYLVKLANKWTPDLSFVKILNPDKSRKEAIAQWDTLNMKEEIHHVSLKLPVVLVNKLWTKPHHSLSSGVSRDSQLGANCVCVCVCVIKPLETSFLHCLEFRTMKSERPNLTSEVLRAIVMGFQWFPKEKALAQLPWSPSFWSYLCLPGYLLGWVSHKRPSPGVL